MNEEQNKYSYTEWSLRRSHPKMHDKPDEGDLISNHPTLKEAKKALANDTDSYIYNEEYRFTVLPSHIELMETSGLLSSDGSFHSDEFEEDEMEVIN